MSRIFTLAIFAFREAVRDRVLHGLLVIFALVCLFSLVLGNLSFAEQTRITLNFALSVMHLCVVGMAIFLAAPVLHREMERKTIHTILVRPVSRPEYLLGKFGGILLVLSLTIFVSSLILALILWTFGLAEYLAVAVSAWGFFIESAVLLSALFLFVQLLKPSVAVFAAIGFFLTGHWLETLRGFAERDNPGVSGAVYGTLIWILPDLEQWNWKAGVVYGVLPDGAKILWATTQAFLWCLFYFFIALIIFDRRDVVA